MIDFQRDNVEARYGLSPLDANIEDIPKYIQILRSIRSDVDDSNTILALVEIKACEPHDGDEHISRLVGTAFHQNYLTSISNWSDYLDVKQRDKTITPSEITDKQDLFDHHYGRYLTHLIYTKKASPRQEKIYHSHQEMAEYYRKNPDSDPFKEYKVKTSNRLLPTSAEVIKHGQRSYYDCILHVPYRWASVHDVHQVIDNLQKKLKHYMYQL